MCMYMYISKSVLLLPGDKLLDCLVIGLPKQIQQGTAEVVSVAVGVAQLVGNGSQEQIPALSVQVDRQVLKDVHVGGGGCGGG